jgi:hypothetical protein
MTGLQRVSGQIIAIDHAKRTVVIRSYDDKKFEATTPLKWHERLDARMMKNKERYFVTCIYLDETIEDCQYFQKPADWPQQQGKPAWTDGKPRNEKLIAFLALHRDAVTGAQTTTTPDTQDYDAFMQMCYDRAKKDVEQAMKDFGGA